MSLEPTNKETLTGSERSEHMGSERAVIRFPAERTGHATRGGATLLHIAGGRLGERLGQLANHLGLPGAIMPTEIHDQATGQHVTVAVGTLFVCLTGEISISTAREGSLRGLRVER
jgi:hypothetical protein